MVEKPHKPVTSAGGSAAQSPWALAGLGTQFFIALIAFGYLGNWLDGRWGTSPLMLLIGVFGGGGGTFYASYRRFMRTFEAAEKGETDSPDASPRP